MSPERRSRHDDVAAHLQMLHEAPGDNPRHRVVRVMNALASVEAEREREALGDVVGRGEFELVEIGGHPRTIADQ